MTTLHGPARLVPLLALLLLPAGALPAGEEAAVLYESQSQWQPPDGGLDGWTIESKEHAVVDDAARGAVLSFGPGMIRLPLEAPPGNRIRIRFVATYTGHTNVGASLLREGKFLRYLGLCNQQTFRHARPDPQTIEAGFVLPAEADAFEFRITCQGVARISNLRILDEGPAPAYAPDGKELLTDPGWEETPARAAIPPENPYRKELNNWMGWMRNNTELLAVTAIPDRVRTGEHALQVMAVGGGFRQARPVRLQPNRCYDFSVWAKGKGTLALYSVSSDASPQFAVSPDEWRQFHFPIRTDNPLIPTFTVGILVEGRVFLDDLSLKEIARTEAPKLVEASAAHSTAHLPPRVAQTVPAGETRTDEPVVLENDFLRVTLSPLGGGHVTEVVDKSAGATWTDLALLALVFPRQPIPLTWNLPFRAARTEDGRSVTFSHTVTGGEAAPFLDGLRIEQIFALPEHGRRLETRFRITNTAAGMRFPLPTVENRLGADSPLAALRAYGSTRSMQSVLQATAGEAGLHTVTDKRLVLFEPIAGWAAACGERGSLVVGYDVRAVQDETLDMPKRTMNWRYLRLPLPPGGSWETAAFLAPVPLPRVAYADRHLAADVRVLPAEGTDYRLTLTTTPLAENVSLRAGIVDYQNRALASIPPGSASVDFTPPTGRFITLLNARTPEGEYAVELFNDPPDRVASSGIHGAGEVQYTPDVPVRVLNLPDVGDRHATIASARTVLWAFGLFSQDYPFAAILETEGMELKRLEQGEGFPEEFEELLAYRMVILSNVGAAHLTPQARAALSQYVRAGGALLVTGGSCALGNARSAGTDLEAMLPVRTLAPFEVQPIDEASRILRPAPGAELEALPWDAMPRQYWKHACTPTAGAKPLVLAGETPILLAGRHGRGPVVLFLGTLEGNPQEGETAAWNWAGWEPLWRTVLVKLLRASRR